MRSGNSERRVSTEAPPLMTFTLGIRELAAWAGADNDVIPSSSLLFRQSTRRPKWERKSTPMMGRVTSATTNRHVKSRRRSEIRSISGQDNIVADAVSRVECRGGVMWERTPKKTRCGKSPTAQQSANC
jgi:hypothetical protein